METIREHLRDEIYELVQFEDVIAEPCGTEPTVGIRILLATRFFPTVNGVSLYSASKPTVIHRTYLIFVGWNDNSYYYLLLAQGIRDRRGMGDLALMYWFGRV